MTLLERRRQMMSRKVKEDWTYILRADSTGKVEKAKILVYPGQHVHMEWDVSRMSENSNARCILSVYGQSLTFTSMNMTPHAWSSTDQILWNQQNIASVFRGGHVDFDITKNVNLYIGCWDESQYTDPTTDRGLIGAYIKIRIT